MAETLWEKGKHTSPLQGIEPKTALAIFDPHFSVLFRTIFSVSVNSAESMAILRGLNK
jgi:hypothetical protein